MKYGTTICQNESGDKCNTICQNESDKRTWLNAQIYVLISIYKIITFNDCFNNSNKKNYVYFNNKFYVLWTQRITLATSNI